MPHLSFALTSLLLVASCSAHSTKPSSTAGSPTDSLRAQSPTPSVCVPPRLYPSYIPTKLSPSSARLNIGGDWPWYRVWRSGVKVLEVAGGRGGDPGEDPSERVVKVRGHLALYWPSLEANGVKQLSVGWNEETPCGHTQYIVVSEGLSSEDLVRVAQSLQVREIV